MHEIQNELDDQIIPDEIVLICFDFYFIDCDRFKINNDVTFVYNKEQSSHIDGYHIFGERRIDREIMDEYTWICWKVANY